MERCVEARDLRQLWASLQNGADGREIVWLMQRREGDIARQSIDRLGGYEHRLAVFRAAMHHPMPYRDKIDALRLPQPGRRDIDRR